jgi:hypothetical protein
MTRPGLLVFLSLLLFMLSLSVHAQVWSGVLAPSRAIDWSRAGVVGGIPTNRTRCVTSACRTVTAAGASSTAAQIQAAISSAPRNSYILLPSGTYKLTAGLTWNAKNNVTLRGAGANQTFLIFSAYAGCQGLLAPICFQSPDTNYWGSPSNLANWTANYSAGTTSITLDSVKNLSVGWPLTLDQRDDLSTADTGDIFLCYTPQTVCSANGDSGGGPRNGRSQQQIVTVTRISGTGPYTVGISPGLYMPNWVASKTPQAWWPTRPVFGDGVEDLSIDASAASPQANVGMFNCVGCYANGITSILPKRSHVQIFQSIHCTVQNSYFYLTGSSASVHYGVETLPASDSLIQNNIFEAVQAPYPATGTCSGCVYSYNFDVNESYDNHGSFAWQNQSGFPHAVGDEHILYEGNIGAGIYSDNFHGTHQFQTIFRNAYNGFQQNNGTVTNGSGTSPMLINSFSRFYNIIGNVLGSTALPHTNYELNAGNRGSVPAGSEIYSNGLGGGVGNDFNTPRTLMRWGNYDVVTKGVRWCGNSSDPGWTTICAKTSEVPSTITNFSNPVPASTSLPASFYLSSELPWWPTSTPWPPIGPDVTGGNVRICVGGANTGAYVTSGSQCPSGTLSSMGGHINEIPAMACYLNTMGGPPTGTGGVLSFNAGNCYGQTQRREADPASHNR